MNLEIEATFLEVDKDEIRQKLQQLGGNLIQSEVLMRRIVFDLHSNHAFARVRDENNRVVLTYKNHLNDTITGTEEINAKSAAIKTPLQFSRLAGYVPNLTKILIEKPGS